MEIAISTSLFAKWNMDINTGHLTKVNKFKGLTENPFSAGANLTSPSIFSGYRVQYFEVDIKILSSYSFTFIFFCQAIALLLV
ncbi:hypothetical protein [Pedobacter gandavensis]|uniref:hypothetical protein n=1 Tax=Pedobacter gandavensis TaxID=2679963 RepID=UPI00160051E1|nr:hypothetical protein [Pedobacter gandavensis]